MLREILAAKLSVGIKKPVFQLSPTCSTELQGRLWSSYVLHRKKGLAPLHVRKVDRFTVRIYKFHCYVVKEYTGDTSKVAMEMAVLQQLQHESLLGFVFMVDEGSRFSVVMDWAGEGLRELVQEQPQQQVGEDIARHITFQLTNSLVYMQNMGVVHRDIKPENIGVQPDFTVKLFDWGEALLLGQLQSLSDKQLAKVAGVAGTPHFMPPEMLLYLTKSSHQCSSSSTEQHAEAGSCSCWGRAAQPSAEQSRQQQQTSAPLRELTSPKLDVWGLGTVVYFLLAGRDVLQQDSSYDLHDMAEVVNATRGIQLPSIVQVSLAARDFLGRCLERDPRSRATAGELLEHPWLLGCQSAVTQQLDAVSSSKTSLPRGPAMLLAPSAEQYVIAAHRGQPGSLPETPVSAGTMKAASELSDDY